VTPPGDTGVGVAGRLPRSGEASGSTAPRRRVPVTPGGWARPAWPRPSAFPFTAPTWPGAVPRSPARRRLGVDYDTDWARRYAARLARVVVTEAATRPLVAAVARPDVTGLDRIAALHGPAIFAANHASHLDTPLLLSVLPEPWRHRLVVAGAADYFFDTRLKAMAFALVLNVVPIERRRIDRASVNRLAGLVGEGWSLLIYPEGGRSPHGWGQPHTAGAAWLASRTGRPLVPVHVAGTRRILPRSATRIRPGRTDVTFGRPLHPGDEDPRVLAARLEQAVAVLADEAASDWWSATRRAAARRTPALTGPTAAAAWRRAWALGPPSGEERPPPWPDSRGAGGR